jgi:hypothetical protein
LALCAACGGGGGSPGHGTATLSAHNATLSLVAGSATESGNADGAGAAARFKQPTGIAIDGAGNLYVADHGNCEIRKITPAGSVSTLAGSSQHCASQDGAGADAGFSFLTALATGPGNTLYAGDGLKIRAISPAGVAGTVTTLETGANVSAADLPFFYVGGLAVDAGGGIYVTNGAGTRRIAAAGGTTMLDGVASLDSLAGVLTSHAFVPRGIAVDSAGTVWIANSDATISTIDASGARTRIAGQSGAPGFADGSGSAARFGQVSALTPDGAGNAFAADSGNSVIRKITPAGAVTTVAGTPNATMLQLGNAPGSLPALAGVAADGKGNLFTISGNAVIKITQP